MKNIFLKYSVIISGICLLAFTGSCKNESDYFTADDFTKVDKIDIHCHIEESRNVFMEQAVAHNFRILTINTDAAGLSSVEEQRTTAVNQEKAYPDRLAFLTTFSMKGFGNSDWQQKTLDYLKESFKMGAIGVKVWKNIGMVEKDSSGKFIMIDDPRIDTIFSYLEKNNIPVCGHIGEPKNCWLPLESMTVNNDRNYFKANPQYHMFLHPEYPSYEAQIAARDNVLRKHPDLKFMGAHLGSLEWSTDELARHLDMYPNFSVDLAARICHIQKQAQTDWQKVRDFFIKYQDRIIYGTDEGDFDGIGEAELKTKIDEVWKRDWKFLTTDEQMESWEVDGGFRGLKLPKEVILKIYNKNATVWFPGV